MIIIVMLNDVYFSELRVGKAVRLKLNGISTNRVYPASAYAFTEIRPHRANFKHTKR